MNLCSGKPAGEKIDTILLAASEDWAKRITSEIEGLAGITKNEIDNYASLARTSFEAGVIRQRMDIYRYGCKDLCEFISQWLRRNNPCSDSTEELALEVHIMELTDALYDRVQDMFPLVTVKKEKDA